MRNALNSSTQLIIEFQEIKEKIIKRTGSILPFSNKSQTEDNDIEYIMLSLTRQKDWLEDLTSGEIYPDYS